MSDSLQTPQSSWNSPGQNTWVSSLSLLQGVVPTQGLNPGLPHYRQILYQLSHQGNLRRLEWVAYPFSSRSSWPRNWTGVSWIAGRLFTSWAIEEGSNASASSPELQAATPHLLWLLTMVTPVSAINHKVVVHEVLPNLLLGISAWEENLRTEEWRNFSFKAF